MTTETAATAPAPKKRLRPLAYDLLMLYVLVMAALLRLAGVYWGEFQYLHPDERFMVWVGSDISPTQMIPAENPAEGEAAEKKVWLGPGEYFDTVNSSLNPNNRGHGFYVYGTLPVFTARYLVEFIYGHSGFKEMTMVGRPLSALADILSVLFVYLIAARLYDRRVGVLAGAFAAVAVLQIQQSHFFTVDTFLNFFIVLSFYFAIRILTDRKAWPLLAVPEPDPGEWKPQQPGWRAGLRAFVASPFFYLSIGFGIAYGCAMASKLNALPVAAILPVAFAIRLLDAPPEQRQTRLNQAILYLALAGFVSLLIFRIFQPYAFSGPGFFGIKPNPAWVEQIRTQRSQATPEFDYPPNMQWARRSFWFSGKNLVLWGLGLPLGVLAWGGFLWAGWRMLTQRVPGEWRRHILLWSWTGAYFLWQSLALNPTMRYQLPIYPMLQIFAAWAVVQLWDNASGAARRVPWQRAAAVLLGSGVLLASLAWAYGFIHIYTSPTTRVAATRWIYQNVPGPINLPIETDEGLYNQPLSYPYGFSITPGIPYQASFRPNRSGSLSTIVIPHIQDSAASHAVRSLSLTLSAMPDGESPLATASLQADLTASGDPRGQSYTFELNQPVPLVEENTYYLSLSLDGQEEALVVESAIDLQIQEPQGALASQVLQPSPTSFRSASPFRMDFQAEISGLLTGLKVANLTDPSSSTHPKIVLVYLYIPAEISPGGALASGDPVGEPTLLGSFTAGGAQAPQSSILLSFDLPVPIAAGQPYTLEFKLQSDQGIITLAGSSIATEGDWDDGLPLRMDNYDGYGGIYPPELNLNMYWDDNPEKLERFIRILNQSDYLTISSSRQWGSLPRMPERFPMTSIYYRDLLGCPAEQSIEECYNIARPGMFQGQLGFELIQTFQSNPSIGPIEINDQPSEEAFTVYDHPKVFIFQKTDGYSSAQVEARLGSVDFSQVLRIAPLQFSDYPADLMLPSDRWAEQQAGGSWSQLFDTQALLNAYPFLGALVWYLSVSLVGLLVYPLLRRALPGLADRGYPLARTAGMLLLAWLVWMLGSYRVPFSRLTISAVLALMALAGLVMAYRQRDELRRELITRRRFFLLVELLALGLFVGFLLVRLGNPDLWHPWKGGEKPMDFSYFNAVLKSTSFPPYDPWFSGGYLNYYYFGFVFVGVLVKWLGIVPSIAYNLILPTIFSLIGLGAFSIAYNLSAHRGAQPIGDQDDGPVRFRFKDFWVGLAGTTGMILLGNLGTVRMIFQGYQKVVAPGGVIEGANVLQHWLWAIQGFFRALAGASLPYGIGDWYWLPSRAIPAPGDVEPITEFPLFTMLYADPHAHMFAMPIALLALAFAVAVVLGRARWKNWFSVLLAFFLGGLAIGALRPTNTWDFYPYLALGVVALGYTLLVHFQPSEDSLQRLPFLKNIPAFSLRVLAAAGAVALLVALVHLLYQPFGDWYGLGYSKLDLWRGTHTPLGAYLTHWGMFLFVIFSWMFWETYEWMAVTPLHAVRKLEPLKPLILALLAIMLGIILVMLVLGAGISWLVLPLAAWAGVLLLRPGLPDSKQVVLFLVGTGLVLTLMVEVIVLRGDIGRMNTVFKFYLQVWTLFAVSAAAALGWLAAELRRWLPNWRTGWQVTLAILVAGAALYPLLGGLAKIKDRMEPSAPHTLDGMTYMAHSTYADTWGQMDLSQDYDAIRWMQENVTGSPVIVEANLRDLYRWGSRFSINTGLPGVTGWEWHQQQQRAVVPGNRVSARIQEIDEFYLTQDLEQARTFLQKYEVKYIILGQQERGKYPGPGLEKFPAAAGVLWREVYREADTIIYEVIEPPG
jgi:YYY domain-containing protein